MLDLGWQELFLIGVVALIVIGPKDMPQVMRSLAGFVRKARALSREFQNGIAQMMREAELDELRRKLDEAGRADVERAVKDTVDPTGSLAEEFDPADFASDSKQGVEEPTIHRPSAAEAAPVAASGDQAEHAGAAPVAPPASAGAATAASKRDAPPNSG